MKQKLTAAWDNFWYYLNKIVLVIGIILGIAVFIGTIQILNKPQILEQWGVRIYKYQNTYGIDHTYEYRKDNERIIDIVYQELYLDKNYELECYVTFGDSENVTSDKVIKLEVYKYSMYTEPNPGNDTQMNEVLYYVKIPEEYLNEDTLYVAIEKYNDEGNVFSYLWQRVKKYQNGIIVQESLE